MINLIKEYLLKLVNDIDAEIEPLTNEQKRKK